MAITVQNGSLVVRRGALGTGPECCCGQFVYTCATLSGCTPINPQSYPDGYPFTVYETLEECEDNCRYLGVICDLFSACLGPQYGDPSLPDVGPASCSDCVPSYSCGGGSLCGFSGYRDINTIAPPFYASQAACESVCIPYCDPENNCAFVSTGVSPEDAGCEGCVPCEECNPLP
jgi:hypothetical protein